MDLDFQFDQHFEIEKAGIEWSHPPDSWTCTAEGLLVNMNPKQDFWSKTYYKPLMIKNNGHLLFKEFKIEEKLLVETKFKLNAKNQFDQGGVMIFVDNEHWIKAGIEFTDGTNRLSCVVTNDYSDWSTQNYKFEELCIRLYKLDNDFVVEAKSPDSDWSFIRICHLNIDSQTKTCRLGLYACGPTAIGGNVLFSYVKYKNVDGFHHSC